MLGLVLALFDGVLLLGSLPSVHLPVDSVELVASLNIKPVVQRVMLLPQVHELLSSHLLLCRVHIPVGVLQVLDVVQFLLRDAESLVHHI